MFAADYAVLKQTHLALSRGRFGEAKALLRSMEPRLGPLYDVPVDAGRLRAWEEGRRWPDADEEDRAVLFTRLYLSMGQWLSVNGFYGHAAVLLERGAVHARPPAPQTAGLAHTPLRLALAAVRLEQGDLGAAGEALREVEATLDEVRRPGPYVDWLELSAKRDLLIGDLGRALERFQRVQDVCWHGGFRRATLAAVLNQAQVLIYVNQTAAAEELLTEAGEAARMLKDPTAAARVAWLARLAHARGESLVEGTPITASATEMQGKWAGGGGRPAPRPASRPSCRRPTTIWRSSRTALAVQWALSRSDRARMGAALERVRRVFGDTESDLIRLRLQVLEGMVAYYRDDWAGAERLFTATCPGLRRLGLKPDLWQARRFQGWCAARLGRPAAECEALSRETHDLVTELADTLSPAQQVIYLVNKWTVEERRLAFDIERLKRAKAECQRGPWFLRPWRRWRLWRGLHEFLHLLDHRRRAFVRRHVAGDPAPPADEPAGPVWRRLWRHPRRRATLSFLVLPDRVFLSRAGWMDLDFAVSPMTRLRLRELVKEWHEQIEEAHPDRLEQTAGKLASGLELPRALATLPSRVRGLTVVPDDALHGFPFAALPINGRPLVEDFAVSLAFDHTPPPATARRRTTGEALVAAVVRGANEAAPLPGGRIYRSLPGTEPEAHSRRRVADRPRTQRASIH